MGGRGPIRSLLRGCVDMTDLAHRSPTDRLGAPVHPPRAWFYETPDWVEPGENNVTVMLDGPDVGRAAGYIWDWHTCWMNSTTGRCDPVQPSPTGGEVFYSGSKVICDDGSTVHVGVIPYRGGHAPMELGPTESRAWMDNPTYQGLVGRIVEDDIGGLFLGQVVPNLTVEDAALIARSKVSGDWRNRIGMRDPDTQARIASGYDFIGATIVSYGAIPRAARGYARLAGLDPDHPNVVGPWVDPTLMEGSMRCAQCDLDHPETTACSTARLAATDDDDRDDNTHDDGNTGHLDGAPGPDVGQSGAPREPSERTPIPATLDVKQMILDAQATAAAVAGLTTTIEAQGALITGLTERVEDISGALLEIEQRLNDKELVVLDESDAERLDNVERATAQLRDSRGSTVSTGEPEAVPAAAS